MFETKRNVIFSHQKCDWDKFSCYEDNEFDKFLDRINAFFKTQGLNFSDDIIYILFGELISRYSFEEYSGIRGREKLSWTIINKFLVEEFDPINFDLLLLGGFHRHPEFESAFLKYLPPKVRVCKAVRSRKKISLKLGAVASRLGDWGLDNYPLPIKKRILYVLANKKLIFNTNTAFDIIGSSHGIYDDCGALMLALCRLSSGRIYIVQSGFIHLQAKYIYQVKYEQGICDRYLSWGGGVNSEKIINLGCMYSWRSKDVEKKCGALIILPQVPSFIPRAFSYYWCCYSDFEADLGRLIRRTVQLKEKYGSIQLRCKSVDLEFYSQLFLKIDLSVSIDPGDINMGEHFDAYEWTHVFYFSTAIAEAFYKGSSVQIEFMSTSFLLDDRYKGVTDFFGDNHTNQKDLEKYLKSFAIQTNPDVYAKSLTELLLVR